MDEVEGFWAEALKELEASILLAQREWAAKTLWGYPHKNLLAAVAEDLRAELESNAVEVNSIVERKQITVVKTPVTLDVPDEVPMEDSLCVFTVGMAKPLAVTDVAQSPFTQGHPAQRWVRSWASVPIVVGGTAAGTVCALELNDPRPWTSEDQKCIERAASRIETLVNAWVETMDKSLI